MNPTWWGLGSHLGGEAQTEAHVSWVGAQAPTAAPERSRAAWHRGRAHSPGTFSCRGLTAIARLLCARLPARGRRVGEATSRGRLGQLKHRRQLPAAPGWGHIWDEPAGSAFQGFPAPLVSTSPLTPAAVGAPRSILCLPETARAAQWGAGGHFGAPRWCSPTPYSTRPWEQTPPSPSPAAPHNRSSPQGPTILGLM